MSLLARKQERYGWQHAVSHDGLRASELTSL
jgi:hypothetical protein